jgi:hypothetical protein
MEKLIAELRDDPAKVGYRALGRQYGKIYDAMNASQPAVYADEEPDMIEREIVSPVPVTFDTVQAAISDAEWKTLPRLRIRDVFDAIVDADKRVELQASGLPTWIAKPERFIHEDPLLYDVVQELLANNEMAKLTALVQLLAASGTISLKTAEALGAALTATETTIVEEIDPEWVPTVISERVPSRFSVMGERYNTAQIRQAINKIGDWA